MGPTLKIVLSKNDEDPTFLFPTPIPFLAKSNPIRKKSLVIKQPPPDIQGIPYLSDAIYNPSSNPAASTTDKTQSLKVLPLTFSIISPTTSVFADL